MPIVCPACETVYRVVCPQPAEALMPPQADLPPGVLARWRARLLAPQILTDAPLTVDDIRGAENAG